MPTFQYKAVDQRTGEIVKNTVSGISNKKELYDKLKRNNLMPIDISTTFELNPNQDFEEKEFKNLEEIINFSQNLLILKKAGADDIDALKAVINRTENKQLKEILKKILIRVENGEYLYNCMETYHNIFPATYSNIIRIGELSNSLIDSLEQAIKYLLKEEKRNQKIKNAIKSKITQILGIILFFISGMLIVNPIIQSTINNITLENELPVLAITLCDIANIFSFIILGLIVICFIALIYINSIKDKYKWHLFKYQAPIFGDLIYTIDFSKVMNSIYISLKNGMNIHEALEESKNVVKNKVMQQMIDQAIDNCGDNNNSWTKVFEETQFGSSVLCEMLKLGIKNDLVSRLDKVIEATELDIESRLQKISKLLTKVVLSLAGLAILLFIIFLLIPAIQIYMQATMM